MMDINLNGSFLFAREAGKYWLDEKLKGNLILVSSMSSIICVRPQKQAAYNAVCCSDKIYELHHTNMRSPKELSLYLEEALQQR
jgi:hypothetical protein